MPESRRHLTALLCACLALLCTSRLAAQNPVHVFILAGQSNMEGKGAAKTLDHLGADDKYGKLLRKVKKKDGSWVVRKDVHIWFMGRTGKLTVGFGSEGGQHGPRIGPELGFGIVLGDALKAPVLLIKTAWGGRDVARDFLPPSAGGPGKTYTEMISHVRDVLKQKSQLFPDLARRRYRISGFVWFQGWNDMIDRDKTKNYADRLVHLIKDVRKEFKRPDLPVVIGELGVGGEKPSQNVARFRKAQSTVAGRFKRNVRFVRTAPFWDTHAHELFKENVWKGPDKERFYKIASDRPYHYLGSGKIQFLMGHAFGEAMKKMVIKK